MSKPLLPQISCGVFDSLSAFYASKFADYLFFSGLSISASQFFEVDSGLHSIERLVDLKLRIASVPNLKPVIADLDDSFGDYSLASTHARTLCRAGFFGAIIEDQARPRKCGHKSGKILNPLNQYVDGLKRFKDSEPSMFLVARTDAETPQDISERLNALCELGSDGIIDAIQIDGISTLEQIRGVTEVLPLSVKFVANHVEGGRLKCTQLSELGSAGVDILTLSSFMLSSYISKLESLSLDRDSLPAGGFSLAQLDELLSQS